MKTIKIPRKLKKSLKLAIVNRFTNWNVNEVKICSVSKNGKYTKRKDAILANGVAVTGYQLGY